MTPIQQRLEVVTTRMRSAADRAGRSSEDVTLVAVSKGHSSESILEVYSAGHRDFGESRGQALAAKAHELPSDIRWHFIGPLQKNKVRLVRQDAFLLHSFDRDSLVGPWLKGPGDCPPALLQINIGREPQKAGVEPDEVSETFERWEASGIPLRGIMAIPPVTETAEAARACFVEMRLMRDIIAATSGHPLELSMGMTNDYEVAIEEGSTMIRVGTAIFGQRTPVVIT